MVKKNYEICWGKDFGSFVPQKFSRLWRDSSYVTNQVQNINPILYIFMIFFGGWAPTPHTPVFFPEAAAVHYADPRRPSRCVRSGCIDVNGTIIIYY